MNIENNWFMDKLNSDLDKTIEVAGRYDGKFNLWRKNVSVDNSKNFNSFWEVIGVFDTEEEAEEEKKARKAGLK